MLAELPIRYVGPVEGHDVALGGTADVVVTDGFTGNVLLKGMEGSVAWSAERLGAAYGDREPARAAARAVATSDFSGGMLLGVRGIGVVARGGGSAESLVACIGPVTAATARELGVAVDVVPDAYTVPALVRAIETQLCKGDGDPLIRGGR